MGGGGTAVGNGAGSTIKGQELAFGKGLGRIRPHVEFYGNFDFCLSAGDGGILGQEVVGLGCLCHYGSVRTAQMRTFIWRAFGMKW